MAVEAESLSPANLSAARQHVRMLSTSEREALLRALLEQYESPQGDLAETSQETSRPRHPASASSIATLQGTLFECPSLPEETEDDGVHRPTALGPAPNHHRRSASSSTATSWPIRSASTSAATTQQSSRQPHIRSHSLSHSALCSSFSTNRQTADSVALFHYRSKSYSTSPELHSKEKEQAVATQAPAEPRSSTESTDTVFHGGLNIITPANADILQGPATVENSSREREAAPFAYWCTSCGDQFSRRSTWAEHDVTCRVTGRHNGRMRLARPQRAWACGFCAAFLGSVERYQDHVAGHFARGKMLADWHYANVIYGLLHQPVVHKAWKRLWAARAAALPVGHRPKATWPSGCKFPTKRTDANAKSSTTRTSSDTRDSGSTEDSGENIVYLGLKEALESFDPAVESASLIVLHAESLAIFISVPIEEGSSSSSGGGSESRSRGDIDKDKLRSRARPRGRGEAVVQTAATAITATATAIATATTVKSSTTQMEGAESRKPDSTTQPTARATTTAAPVPSPPTAVAPSVTTFISAAAAAPASTPTPASLSLGTGRAKDGPLPALPLFATLAASLSSPPASSSNKSTKKESKTRRTSVRAAALKPLNLFRSKESETASKDKDKEKEKEKGATAAKKTFMARSLALGSATTVTAGSPPDAAAGRPPHWADRPLPPLIMDDNPAASLAASSSSPSPSSSPDTQARLVSADHYTLTSPASSLPPKTQAPDMDRMAATYVDDFMASINAKRAVRG